MRLLVPTLLAAALAAQDIGPQPYAPPTANAGAVAAMGCDAATAALFQARGLDVLSLTWEDTGRWKNSAVGPNISDLTIQLLDQPTGRRTGDGCMPVVRYPNYADTSCDVPIERLQLLVGNESGSGLRRLDLRSYLEQFAQLQSFPTGRLTGSLVGNRDRRVLTSAQACFLPIAPGGATTFAPVLFNYQSRPEAPAVLTILVTPEGTSAQVITNGGEAASGVWHGQRLFHNRAGQRAALRATRFSDHQAQQATAGVNGEASADGLSLVLVIQVPLKQPEPQWRHAEETGAATAAAPFAKMERRRFADTTETAVVASGVVEGPWLGLAGHTIERDWRFPIRATVQFYQATNGAQVTPGDVERVAHAIERVYLDADAVGSLVVDGATCRTTDHAVAPEIVWPQPWWRAECETYSERTGEAWPIAVARVRARLGAKWQPADARELRNALALVRP